MSALVSLRKFPIDLKEIAGLSTPSPERAKPLPLGLNASLGSTSAVPGGSSIDDLLPDGGLPRGAVVELASKRSLARSTSLALAACAAAQAEARLRSGDERTVGAWCAFVDPWSTLHAPALARRGVDPSRLLVVRPPVDAVARVAVRIAQSRAFAMIAIDLACVPGAELEGSASTSATTVRLDRWVNVVRRLALAVEKTDTSILLLTDASASRGLPLPVAMRLELAVDAERQWVVKIGKERHGRVGQSARVGAAVLAG